MLGISKDSTYLSLREALASWQSTVSSIHRRLIASLTLAMTRNSACKNIHCHVERSEISCHCERAHWASAAIERAERLTTFDCFGCRLAITQNTTYKNVHCHVERSATSHNFHNLPNHLKQIPIFLNHLWNFQIILRITDNHGCDSSLNRLLGA